MTSSSSTESKGWRVLQLCDARVVVVLASLASPLASKSHVESTQTPTMLCSSGGETGSQTTIDYFDNLATRYTAAKLAPYHASRMRLAEFRKFIDAAVEGISDPTINLGEDHGVELEWWFGGKTLTIFISARGMTYLRTWGTDTMNKMEDGPLVLSDFVSHWTWLKS